MDVLRGAKGKTLEARARWVLNLRDLQHVCRPSRTWVSRAEFTEVWSRDKPEWTGEWVTPKQDLMRMKRWLRDVAGVEVLVETIDGENRIHVDVPELRDLVDVNERKAKRVDAIATALRRGEAVDLVDEEPSVLNLQSEYQDGKKPLRVLSIKYGMGRDRIRKMLLGRGGVRPVEIREARRMRICEIVGPERTARALRLHDEGASLARVARELGLATKASARRFLLRHGRDTRPASERELPRSEPPVAVAGAAQALACALWAT